MGTGQLLDLCLIGMDHVSEPHVLAQPVDRLSVFHRALAEHLQAKAILILGFCQVGMQIDQWIPPGQGRALAHQIGGDAEGGARGQRNTQH